MSKQQVDSNGDIIQLEIEERIKKQIVRETASDFSKKVEALVWEQDLTYMEALSQVMEEGGHEPERIAKMVTPELKSKLQKEAEELSLIKKTNHRLDDII